MYNSIMSVFFLVLFSPISFAQLDNSGNVKGNENGTLVNSAWKVSIQKSDIETLIKGSSDLANNTVISSSVKEPIKQSFYKIPVIVTGISYQYKIKDLDVKTEDKKLTVSGKISEFKGNVDQVSFWSEKYFCKGIKASSEGVDIPFSLSASPEILLDKDFMGKLKLNLEKLVLEFTTKNFVVAKPDQCDVVWTGWANRRLANLVPFITRQFNENIGEKLSERVKERIESLSQSLNSMLAMEITLPFELKNVKPFYGTTTIFPTALEITPQALSFVMGTRLKIDANAEFPDESMISLNNTEPPKPSTTGMSLKVLNALFKEAVREKIYETHLTKKSTNFGEKFFKVHSIGQIIFPKLESIVDGDDLYELKTTSLGSAQIVAQLDEVTKKIRLKMELKDINLEFWIGGELYASVMFNLFAPVTAESSKKESRIVQFAFNNIEVKNIKATFNQTFSKINKEDKEKHFFDQDTFDVFLETINQEVVSEKTQEFMKIELPEVNFDNFQVSYDPIQLDGDFVTLAFRLKLKNK